MELSPIVLIIWGELTFLMAGGLALLSIKHIVGKSKGKKSVSELMEKIKADREARKIDIRKGLAAYGLKDDALEAKVSEIDKRERKFYQRIANMYQNRSDAMLATLNVAFEGTTKPYYELDMKLEMPTDQAEEQEQGGVDQAELDALKKQNQELQDELAVTMETIGRMLSEYSSMFGSEETEGLDKDKIMEAFEVDESPEIEEPEIEEPEIEEPGTGDVEKENATVEEDVEEVEVVSDLTVDDDNDDLEIVTDLDDEEAVAEPASENVDDLDVDALFESAQADIAIPDDELLEIGDEPILTSTLDDKEDEILSDLVDLEAGFGDVAGPEKATEKETDAGSSQAAQTDAIDDLDIDALLEDNKN